MPASCLADVVILVAEDMWDEQNCEILGLSSTTAVASVNIISLPY